MPSHSPKATRPRLHRSTSSQAPLDFHVELPSSASASGDVEARVRCEFFEMRGFSPTVQQAARLFQLNRTSAAELLTRLVQEGFLRQTPDGRFRLPS